MLPTHALHAWQVARLSPRIDTSVMNASPSTGCLSISKEILIRSFWIESQARSIEPHQAGCQQSRIRSTNTMASATSDAIRIWGIILCRACVGAMLIILDVIVQVPRGGLQCGDKPDQKVASNAIAAAKRKTRISRSVDVSVVEAAQHHCGQAIGSPGVTRPGQR